MATRKTAGEVVIPASEFDELTEQANMGRQLMKQPEEEEDEPSPETATDRVAAMLSGIGDDARAVVKLYRVTGPNKYSWCEEYTPSDFEAGGIKMIRDQFGPGAYDVRLYGMREGRDGRTGFGVRAKERIDIEAVKSLPAVAAQQTSEIARVLEAMQAQQAAMLEALTRRPEPVDPMAQMMSMFGMMKAMREAMGDTGQKQSQIGEIVAAMRELREVSDELSPPKESSGDPLTEMIPQVLQLIQTGMAQRPGGEQPVAPMMLPPVTMPPFSIQPTQQVTQHPAQPQIDNPIAPDPNIMLNQLKQYLADLLKGATEKADPQEHGDIVYEKAPDEIIELMMLPNWFDMLCQFEPLCAPHREWFTAVHTRVFDLLAEDKSEEQESVPANYGGSK